MPESTRGRIEAEPVESGRRAFSQTYTSRAVMKRIVILISGRGSNMQAIVQRCAAEGWPAQVAAVIANRPDAAGLSFAREHGIATAVVEHTAYASRAAFDAALAEAID